MQDDLDELLKYEKSGAMLLEEFLSKLEISISLSSFLFGLWNGIS
jgi:hypothetical protein